MDKPAAISAQLVDVRNVGTHKVVKLTIHVPEEQAAIVIDAFGWPTMTNPLPVAIARLNTGAGTVYSTPSPPSAEKAGEHERIGQPLNPSPKHADPAGADPQSRPGGAKILSPSQRAWLLCQSPTFREFLFERCQITKQESVAEAADAVREWCCVKSRSELDNDPDAHERWNELTAEYDFWQRGQQF